jgi:hypothetical protein
MDVDGEDLSQRRCLLNPHAKRRRRRQLFMTVLLIDLLASDEEERESLTYVDIF